ncbi:HD domain-containing protein [Treponema sp.]|uniref:CCA tRNA nucleotidyltransferase n=1 Tax=Treponema sp. TaxID=166 RepID=UPI0025F0AD8E|nr:HD domain-containing protein [Treponema sp.]MCR5218859.1 HD domain-containing protein [Treponema sp.]
MFGRKIKVPEKLHRVWEIFNSHGHSVYLVGGAVRDELLGKKSHDWDLATDAAPEQVMSIFKRVIPTGIAHGTVTIHIMGLELETTTFRTDSTYTDGRHPDSVQYTSDINEDLSRRDFTMNAIACSLEDGSLIDPFGGEEDIKKGIIRTVGNPLERFDEDGLRPVRAVRFAGQLGFKIEENTLRALSDKKVLERTAGISVERFRDEFMKIMSCPQPSLSLKLLEDTGIMNLFIPEFKVCRGCIQNDGRGFHEFDVADHILYSCDGIPAEYPLVRLAAFYHDIGKPECRTVEEKDGARLFHFHHHEAVSEKKAQASMTHLKFSNEEIKHVCHLVKEHMFFYESSWSDAAVRRFIIRIGLENLDELFMLRLGDVYGMHRVPMAESSPSWKGLLELKDRIKSITEKNNALSLKDLAVSGKDLIEKGIPAGKVMGMILKELLECVIESPDMNDRDKLLNTALNIYRVKFS